MVAKLKIEQIEISKQQGEKIAIYPATMTKLELCRAIQTTNKVEKRTIETAKFTSGGERCQ